MAASLSVYRASAGSGKTFTLTVQFIKAIIAKQDHHAFAHILAVTFTNKATAEMKDRILQQLYGIAKHLPSSDRYLNALNNELSSEGIVLTDNQIRQRADGALIHILHNYDLFHVTTIDSFFQLVLKNLAHELNLTANLKVDLDDKQAVSKAVDDLMEHLNEKPWVLKWVKQYVQSKIDDNTKWDISKELKSFAGCIFSEEFLLHEDNLRHVIGDESTTSDLCQQFQQAKTTSRNNLRQRAQYFLNQMNACGIDFSFFSYGEKRVKPYIENINNGSNLVHTTSTIQKSIQEPLSLLCKKDQETPEKVNLAQHFSTILADIDAAQQEYISAKLAFNEFYCLGLITKIDETVLRINNEHSRFMLAKTPFLLNELIQGSDTPFILEKIGTTFNHVMIDEFQDTSAIQWNIFKVLLLENIAVGNSNLLVGDIKQSIYRWRNSDWTILGNIASQMIHYKPVIKNLDTNYRSLKNIITFNNNFFTSAAEQLDTSVYNTHFNISQVYQDVTQKCASCSNESGFVRFRFIEADKKNKNDNLPSQEDDKTQILNDLCNQVRTLNSQGVPYNKMTILLRKRNLIEPILAHFAKDLPDVKLVSDEAFKLVSSKSVNLLIAAMQYTVNPDNQMALAYILLNAPQTPINSDTKPYDITPLCTAKNQNIQPKSFFNNIEHLKNLPLYELQEELYQTLQLNKIPNEEAYIFSYFDFVQNYLDNNPSDIPSFLKYWDETLQYKTIPTGESDGIRIYTIHQAKGLQFHTVLLPFCDWEIVSAKGNKSKDILWCSSDKEPYSQLPVIPIQFTRSMEQSLFNDYYSYEIRQRYLDSLNLLYVAFTRAEKNLLVWCRKNEPKDKKSQNKISTVGNLIYQVLSNIPMHPYEDSDTSEVENNTSLFSIGEPYVKTETTANESDNRLEFVPEPLSVPMVSNKPNIEFRQSNKAQLFFDNLKATTSYTIDKRKLGILLHKVFSIIHTKNDVIAALSKIECEGLIESQSEKQTLISHIKQAFLNPLVSHWFDGSCTVFNEYTILTANNDTQKTTSAYRPDRVMFDNQNVTIVDFKFGSPHNEHKRQVANYVSILKQMEPEKTIKGYLWYILENHVTEVINHPE